MTAVWSGKAAAYDVSFARMCAGALPALRAAIGAPPRPDAQLLDAGTGTGRIAAAFAEQGWSVLGVDAEPDMLAVARQRHPSLRFDEGVLPRLALAEGSMDAVTANFVINHVAAAELSVRELARVTRRGAPLALTVWPHRASRLTLLWNAVIDESGAERATTSAEARPRPALEFERTVDGLARLLEQSGLIEVEVTEIDWSFEVAPADLWRAAEAGIAFIGQILRTQSPAVQDRMRDAYLRLSADLIVDGLLRTPVSAILGTGHAPR